MKHKLLLVALFLSARVMGAAEPLPPEVERFIADRDVCDHFGGEDTEGDTPEQQARRAFIAQSVEIFCSGTDRRLAALRQRYKDHPTVIERLRNYEDKIEAPCSD